MTPAEESTRARALRLAVTLRRWAEGQLPADLEPALCGELRIVERRIRISGEPAAIARIEKTVAEAVSDSIAAAFSMPTKRRDA